MIIGIELMRVNWGFFPFSAGALLWTIGHAELVISVSVPDCLGGALSTFVITVVVLKMCWYYVATPGAKGSFGR